VNKSNDDDDDDSKKTVAHIDGVNKVEITTPCPEKNGSPKQNAVTCTIYNTIQ